MTKDRVNWVASPVSILCSRTKCVKSWRPHFRGPKINDLNEMTYLEWVLQEMMRLYPTVPAITRNLTEDTEIGKQSTASIRFPHFTLCMPEVHWNSTAKSAVLLILHLSCVSGCYTNPRRVDILIPIFYVHRSAEYFPKPLKFDPDNFLPERVIKRHPYSYIPFSAGPRNCIGQKFSLMKEKTILSYILRHYRVHAVHMELPIIPDMTMRLKNGVPVNFTPRNKNTSA